MTQKTCLIQGIEFQDLSGSKKVGGGSEERFTGRAAFAIVWLKVKQVTKGVGRVFRLEKGETKMRLETSGKEQLPLR